MQMEQNSEAKSKCDVAGDNAAAATTPRPEGVATGVPADAQANNVLVLREAEEELAGPGFFARIKRMAVQNSFVNSAVTQLTHAQCERAELSEAERDCAVKQRDEALDDAAKLRYERDETSAQLEQCHITLSELKCATEIVRQQCALEVSETSASNDVREFKVRQMMQELAAAQKDVGDSKEDVGALAAAQNKTLEMMKVSHAETASEQQIRVRELEEEVILLKRQIVEYQERVQGAPRANSSEDVDQQTQVLSEFKVRETEEMTNELAQAQKDVGDAKRALQEKARETQDLQTQLVVLTQKHGDELAAAQKEHATCPDLIESLSAQATMLEESRDNFKRRLVQKEDALTAAKEAADAARQREQSIQEQLAEMKRERDAVGESPRKGLAGSIKSREDAESQAGTASKQDETRAQSRSSSSGSLLERVATHEILIASPRATFESSQSNTFSNTLWYHVGKSEEAKQAEALDRDIACVEGLVLTLEQAERQQAIFTRNAARMQQDLREAAARQKRSEDKEAQLNILVSQLCVEVQRVRARWEHSCLQLSSKMNVLEANVDSVCLYEAGADKVRGAGRDAGDAALGVKIGRQRHARLCLHVQRKRAGGRE